MTASAPLILLTGAAGFVGRQVLRVLGERGCRVRPVVRAGKQETLARVGEMAAVLAHEVRNPLTGLHNGLEIVAVRSDVASFAGSLDRLANAVEAIRETVEENTELSGRLQKLVSHFRVSEAAKAKQTGLKLVE